MASRIATSIIREYAVKCVEAARSQGWEGSGYELTKLDCEVIRDRFSIRLGRDASDDEMLDAAQAAREEMPEAVVSESADIDRKCGVRP